MPHYPKPFYRAPLKKWYVQIRGKQLPLGDDPSPRFDKDGKPIPPQGVVDRYHELMAARDKPSGPVEADLAVAVVDQFLDWVQRRKAPRTYEWYRRHLQNLARGLPTGLTVADLKPRHVDAIVDARDDWSASTRHAFARCAQRAFRWAAQQGLIARSPIADLVKAEPEAREIVISAEEYAAILDVVREPNLRDLIVAAWETGARPRELITVEARFVELPKARWVFPRKKAKGKKRTRAVYLSDTALEITRRRMAAHPTGPLFTNSAGEPWTRWSVNNAFIRIRRALGRRVMAEKGIDVPKLPRLRKAAIEPGNLAQTRAQQKAALAGRRKEIARLALEHGPEYHLGAFRHSFADRLLKAGVDPITVANLMGHRNLAMLANVYSHLNQDEEYLRDALGKATGPGA